MNSFRGTSFHSVVALVLLTIFCTGCGGSDDAAPDEMATSMKVAQAVTAGGVQIKTKAGLCLDASVPAAVVQQTCNSASAAQVFDGTTTAGRFARGGNCLGASSSTNGTQLSMLACSNAATAWTTPSGTLKNTASVKCADIPGNLSGVAGTKAQIWSCDGSNEQQFTVPAVAAAITVQGQINAKDPLSSDVGSQVQVVNTYPQANTIAEPGVRYTGTVLGNSLRWGRLADPVGSGRTVFRHAVKSTDPDTAGAKRVDVSLSNGAILKNTTYWSAFEILMPQNTLNAQDNMTLSAVHIGPDCCSGNWELQLNKSIFQFVKTYNTGDGTGDHSIWTTISPQPTAGVWHKVVVQYKLNNTGANGAFVKAWIDGTLVYNDTGPNTIAATGDYQKFGLYAFQLGTSSGDRTKLEREVFYRSYYLVKDNGYQLADIVNLLQ